MVGDLTVAHYMVVSQVFSQGFVADCSAPLCCFYSFSGSTISITRRGWSIWIKPASFKEVMSCEFCRIRGRLLTINYKPRRTELTARRAPPQKWPKGGHFGY